VGDTIDFPRGTNELAWIAISDAIVANTAVNDRDYFCPGGVDDR
jgi:hypothetical protein